jgi:hypothetical protein
MIKKPRRVNKEKPTNAEELEKLIERRSEAFISLLNKMHDTVSPEEAKIIATFATKDGYMSYSGNQNIEDLSDLKVEELTEVEFVTVLKRAKHAYNVILENKVNYVAGPFYKNRYTTRTMMALAFKASRAKTPTGQARARLSSKASNMVKAQKQRKAALQVMQSHA